MSEYRRKLYSWKFRDDGNSEWGEINYRGIIGKYMDCDGDATEWSVSLDTGREEPSEMARGIFWHQEEQYHADQAMEVIENIILTLSGDLTAKPLKFPIKDKP